MINRNNIKTTTTRTTNTKNNKYYEKKHIFKISYNDKIYNRQK